MSPFRMASALLGLTCDRHRWWSTGAPNALARGAAGITGPILRRTLCATSRNREEPRCSTSTRACCLPHPSGCITAISTWPNLPGSFQCRVRPAVRSGAGRCALRLGMISTRGVVSRGAAAAGSNGRADGTRWMKVDRGRGVLALSGFLETIHDSDALRDRHHVSASIRNAGSSPRSDRLADVGGAAAPRSCPKRHQDRGPFFVRSLGARGRRSLGFPRSFAVEQAACHHPVRLPSRTEPPARG